MRGWGLLLFVSIAVGTACVGSDSGVREDELICEEAVARLTQCCGTLTYPYDCTYVPPEACSSAVYPDIPTLQGQCIRKATCESLVASGACNANGAYGVTCQ
jgi:hypothetical protein